MSNVPLAVELREKYNLSEKDLHAARLEYEELHLQILRTHLENMASSKTIEFSIHFIDTTPKFAIQLHQPLKYSPPMGAFVLPLDMKNRTYEFLKAEGFYFEGWSEHCHINLTKEPNQ